MRNVILALATVASAFALVHCAGGASSGSDDLKGQEAPSTGKLDSGTGTPPSKPPSTPPADGGAKQVADAASPDAAPPPPAKGNKDAGGPENTGPGPTCLALSACCSKLTNSLEQVGCLLATGKKNELICGGAMVTFNCAGITNPPPNHGPSCAGLTSGALYCGNDGPNGDPNTLYQCSGSSISIVRQCPNGCKTNPGVDDSCNGSGGGGGTSGANCSGHSGLFCGGDGVGGNANTLYDCENDAVASSQVCANGCVTNPDPAINDYCETSSGGGGGGVSCSGLPDYKYCGSDGVNGDPNTLYTCKGGSLTGSQPCANGCTVGSSNTDDYCSYTSGGGGADCTGLSDGTYCGSNGVHGDPGTLYTCSYGTVSDSAFCSSGCYAGDFGGSDLCN